MRSVYVYKMKEEKTFLKPLAGIEPHIFGFLVRHVNHYTTRTNHTGNAMSSFILYTYTNNENLTTEQCYYHNSSGKITD